MISKQENLERKTRAIQLADEWNKKYPTGTRILIHNYANNTTTETTTRSAAIEAYGEAVIWVKGNPASISLLDIEAQE